MLIKADADADADRMYSGFEEAVTTMIVGNHLEYMIKFPKKKSGWISDMVIWNVVFALLMNLVILAGERRL